MGRGKHWTREEDRYLEENWGTRSIQTLSRKLNRSNNAILLRKTRLGLGRFLDSGDYVTYSQLLQAVYGLEGAGVAYRLPKKGKNFPIRKKRVGSHTFKVVYLNDFWEWAEEHKRLLDFSKMPENILGAEPDWVKSKRKIDYECRLRNDPWTPADDAKLQRLLKKYKYTYTGLAVELNRSEGAVKRRICTLGLKERPLKAENNPWKPEEVQKLVFMYEEGYSFDRIGAELGRTGLACRGKMERIQNPDYFLRENRRKAKQTK